jgi:hypothetical protein
MQTMGNIFEPASPLVDPLIRNAVDSRVVGDGLHGWKIKQYGHFCPGADESCGGTDQSTISGDIHSGV